MEDIELPPIGQTLSRESMPQIDNAAGFIKTLGKEGISTSQKTFKTDELKSTQSNFDKEKIAQLIGAKDKVKPIFVSNDNHILDGHHRWIADHNTTGYTRAHVVDLPILELVKKAHDFNNQMSEEITHKDFGPMMDSFVAFASNKLGIKSMPSLKHKQHSDDFTSFGGYNPFTKSIEVVTKNRHPMDIFRTIAHELVHAKQDEDGRIKDVAKEGSTGSDIENEANSMAGKIMRWYAQANPDKFKLSHMVESKMDKDLNKLFEEHIDPNNPCNREWGTTSLAQLYAMNTPGQEEYISNVIKQRMKKRRKMDESVNPYFSLPKAGGLGPEAKVSGLSATVGGYTAEEDSGCDDKKKKIKTLDEFMQEPAEMGTVPSTGQEPRTLSLDGIILKKPARKRK